MAHTRLIKAEFPPGYITENFSLKVLNVLVLIYGFLLWPIGAVHINELHHRKCDLIDNWLFPVLK